MCIAPVWATLAPVTAHWHTTAARFPPQPFMTSAKHTQQSTQPIRTWPGKPRPVRRWALLRTAIMKRAVKHTGCQREHCDLFRPPIVSALAHVPLHCNRTHFQEIYHADT